MLENLIHDYPSFFSSFGNSSSKKPVSKSVNPLPELKLQKSISAVLSLDRNRSDSINNHHDSYLKHLESLKQSNEPPASPRKQSTEQPLNADAHTSSLEECINQPSEPSLSQIKLEPKSSQTSTEQHRLTNTTQQTQAQTEKEPIEKQSPSLSGKKSVETEDDQSASQSEGEEEKERFDVLFGGATDPGTRYNGLNQGLVFTLFN